MAEGFEPYHVPQQSRRDKLRVHHPGCAEPSARIQGYAGLLPLYDPSLLSSDLLTCADDGAHDFHHQNHPLGAASEACKGNRSCVVKEEGENFMGFVGGIVNASSSASHHPYFDPQSSLHISPSSIQDINNNPFLYTPQNLQNLRDFEQSYNGGEVLLFKPEPLSLSLSSHQNNLPLELNLQRYGSAMYSVKASADYVASTSNDVSRSSVPLGPFTGYASILKGSRFLRPAQQLLEEFCDVGRGIYVEKATPESALMGSPMESGIVDDQLCSGDGGDHQHGGKKSRLSLMLDEVYRRYKQYYEQLQAVVASFEYVAGLGNAAPYANLALKAMSKHFRCLKDSIIDQLQITGKGHGHLSHEKDEGQRFLNTDRGVYNQRSVQNLGFLEHQPVWRPQRGLPERAVTVLRAWLFEHFLHPYPTDTDKIMLAKQTGLSRSQVSNWFINARVRLWKPMVEEIHTLETRQAQKASQREEQNANASRDHLSSSGNSLASENPSTSTRRAQDTPPKRTRNEHPDHISTVGTVEPVNLSYNNLSRQPQVGFGPSSNVSLTLGLHQNNGIGLSEPFSISAAQRFGLGLEENNEGYVMGNFEAQNRHFGRDVIGGQLLHDFVG